MPGFDGTGPLGVGPRLGQCFFPGGGMLFHLAVIGLGIFAISRLLHRNEPTVQQTNIKNTQ